MIPFVNRTADVILHSEIEARDVNVREVIEDFRGQLDSYTDIFQAVVLMAPGRYRVTFKSARKLEVAENFGFTVRGFPVTFKPVSLYKWVNITRLSYGVPDEEISKVLSVYGPIKLIKSEQYLQIYTGVRNVLMEVRTAIPARIRIAGHWCAIYYKGQKRVCFSCNVEGHVSRRCPSKTVPSTSVTVGASLRGPVPLSSDVNVGAAIPIAPAGACISPARSVLVNVVPTPGSLVDASPVQVYDVPVDGGVTTEAAGKELALFSDVVQNLVASVVANVDPSDDYAHVADPNPKQSAPLQVLAQAGSLDVGSLRPETSVLSPVPLRSSVLGAKRLRSWSRSASRSKSRSPLRKGSRAAVLSSDSASDDGHSYSLESEVVSSVNGEDDLPLTDNFFASFSGFETQDDPLTQYTANLPCPTQDRVHFLSEPEASQVSEESAFIAKLFTTSASPSGEVESSE
jgi:hypothetical protein